MSLVVFYLNCWWFVIRLILNSVGRHFPRDNISNYSFFLSWTLELKLISNIDFVCWFKEFFVFFHGKSPLKQQIYENTFFFFYFYVMGFCFGSKWTYSRTFTSQKLLFFRTCRWYTWEMWRGWQKSLGPQGKVFRQVFPVSKKVVLGMSLKNLKLVTMETCHFVKKNWWFISDLWNLHTNICHWCM